MLANWLFRTAIELSLLIGLVILLRPWVRRWLGAQVAYWLWALPLARVVLWVKLPRPEVVLTGTGLPDGLQQLTIAPGPATIVVPSAMPLEAVWLAGLLAWLALRVASWYRLRRVLATHARPLHGAPENALPAAERGQVPRLTYWTADLPSAPFVTGLFRPRIYLPADFEERFPADRQKWVLRHELAHLRRRDLWAQLLGDALRAVFWFNPIVHLAWPLFCEDQEYACDHHVLRHCGSRDRHEYGSALVQGLRARVFTHTLAFISHPKERFLMLANHKQSRLASATGIALCGLVALFAFTEPSAQVSHPAPWEQQRVSLQFKEVPLPQIVDVIFNKFIERPVAGVELLPTTLVNIKLKNVTVESALAVLLDCHGFAWQHNGDGYRIVARPAGAAPANPQACIQEQMEGPASTNT